MADVGESVSSERTAPGGLLIVLGCLGLFWATVVVEVVRNF